jgi:hypothetical protein
VFLPFLDCVSGFGHRENDDDHTWEGFHRRVPSGTDDSGDLVDSGTQCPSIPSSLCSKMTPATEVCYLFRYMALNGRTTGSPWSLRQCAVYQRIDASRQRAIWILIQPEPGLLIDFFATIAQGKEFNLLSCLEPHLILLNAGTRKWKQFTAHLRQTLYLLVS